MRHPLPALVIASLILASCVSATEPTPTVMIPYGDDALVAEPSPIALEQWPQSVADFSTMTLSGSDLRIGKVLEANTGYTKYFITYRSNGLKISGTLAIPKGDGPFPLIIQNHGYIDPAIYTNGRGLRREQDAMARAKFAVLHTDYRGHAQSDDNPNAEGPYENGLGYALDSINAILAAKALHDPRIDAERVGMIGHSMGGGVTMQILVAHPELIDAAVLYAPVNTDAWENFSRWNDDQEYAPITFATFGGTKEEAPDAWAAISPHGSLKNIQAPVLLFHGLKDKDVPIEWSNQLNLDLEALDKDIRYITYPKEGHEFGETWKHFMDTTVMFLNEHLRPTP